MFKSLKTRQGQQTFLDDGEEVQPLATVANLVDVMLVFSVALMVAIVSYLQLPELMRAKDLTVITNPGQPDMKIIVKEGEEIHHYEASDSTGSGQGELLGQAYRLPDGRVIYVPAEKERAAREASTSETPAAEPATP